MFSHQVITDLKSHSKTTPDPVFRDNLILICDLMHKSMKFYIGEQDEFLALFKKYNYDSKTHKTTALFKGELGQDIRLPSKICWVDFTVKTTEIAPGNTAVPKRGILAIEIDPDLIGVYILNYLPKTKDWMPSPNAYLIGLDRILDINIFHTYPSPFNRLDTKVSNSESVPNISTVPLLKNVSIDSVKAAFYDDGPDLKSLNMMLMLLNCKNVTNEVVEAPVKLNKKRRKKGRQELYKYHTLQLVLPNKNRKYSAGSIKSSDKVPLHICRGHFKNYIPESPLFGKYIGRYWWQSHTRGVKEKGVIEKNYNVTVKN